VPHTPDNAEDRAVAASVHLQRDGEPRGRPPKSFCDNGNHASIRGYSPWSVADARKVFAKWLGKDYDTGTSDALMCTLAAAQLPGDPLWLLVVSGSGNAKTETVQAAKGAGAVIVSTIASEAALLSGTAKKERSKDATGGLLRSIGERGVLVVKDMTSILSMDRTTRGGVLAALREIHDGYWCRNVGTDGGRTLDWTGRLVIIGACTTAWDRAHDVIASMGDRFVIVRPSDEGREAAGRQAMANTGREELMREALQIAVAHVLAGMDTAVDLTLTDDEVETLLGAANLVTLARTAVDYDGRGNVIDAHAPEMPTRFAKQLQQLVRGGLALGMERDEAMALAIRCARDSMPPLRLAILLDVTANPNASTAEIRDRLDKPRTTIDRQLQSLNMLGVLRSFDVGASGRGQLRTYRVTSSLNPDVLTFTRKVVKEGPESVRERATTHLSTNLVNDSRAPCQDELSCLE
jgi:hypothetical protein